MRHFIAIALAFASCPAGAAEIALVGTIGDKAAILAIDGGDPKAVRVGQTWNGILVLSVERQRATIEADGKKRVLLQGQTYRPAEAKAAKGSPQSITIAADGSGHFVAEGAVNNVPVRFLVDTGASAITLPGAEARRIGLDYRNGPRGYSQTAAGLVPVYMVRLDRVRLGQIELDGVDAIVIEQGLTVPLLGMTFLNRLDMRREGERLTLTRRF